MEESKKAAVELIAKKSYAGESTFGEVVGTLVDLGVESYFSDYRTGTTAYYFSNGENEQISLGHAKHSISMDFNVDAIKSAILCAQKDEIRYPKFIELTVGAGCVGYIVWIAGRHVTYFGRR